jgi:hypothetical protein
MFSREKKKDSHAPRIPGRGNKRKFRFGVGFEFFFFLSHATAKNPSPRRFRQTGMAGQPTTTLYQLATILGPPVSD